MATMEYCEICDKATVHFEEDNGFRRCAKCNCVHRKKAKPAPDYKLAAAGRD
jgi:hypothetical protein